MLESRKDAAIAIFGGRIVVSGGYFMSPDYLNEQVFFRIVSRRTVEMYDQSSNEWSRMLDMLEARSSHASVSIRNKLYIVGGTSRNCEVFDTFGQVFLRLINPGVPVSNSYKCDTKCVSIGNKIIVF